jgi:hypothetical protein
VLLVYLRWSRVPLIIGYVLAVPIERYLTLSYSLYQGFGFLARPWVLVLSSVIVLLLVGPPLAAAIGGRAKRIASGVTS